MIKKKSVTSKCHKFRKSVLSVWLQFKLPTVKMGFQTAKLIEPEKAEGLIIRKIRLEINKQLKMKKLLPNQTYVFVYVHTHTYHIYMYIYTCIHTYSENLIEQKIT